jgi:mono/diheme cytochrome c family protein
MASGLRLGSGWSGRRSFSSSRSSRPRLGRLRIVIVAILLLGLLDFGRSLYARHAYATPTQVWEPRPAAAVNLRWPPGADLPQTAPLGQRVYAERCTVCHGPEGRGNGPAAPSMIPRPRDLTFGFFKYRTTPPEYPPRDEDLIRTITNGLPGSAMPHFHDVLSEDEIRAVVAHIKGFSPLFKSPQVARIPVPPRPRPDADGLARGRVIYERGCAACHGVDGRAMTLLADAKGLPVRVRDLTAPWTFRGGSRPDEIWMRVTTGLRPGPMPSFGQTLSVGERWDVVNYVISLARIPPWERGGKLDGPGHQTDLVKRGEYLVRAEMCGLCHTQVNATGIYRDDAYLAGGMRVQAYPHGVYVSRNLTSDAATGLGAWTEDQIVDAIRNGRARERILNLWGMPWMYLHGLRDADARAIARYLKTLRPVRNAVPPPLRYGVVETIAAKIQRSLPAASPTVLTYADGNFGLVGTGTRSGGLRLPFNLDPQKLLILGQWLVIVWATVAYAFAPRNRPRAQYAPRRGRPGRIILAALAAVAIGVAAWAIYGLPALRAIPPEQIADSVTRAIPAPSVRGMPAERAALVERGRYLFTVASCAFCHGSDGSGGAKVSWKPFGTLWTRNISSDPATGIGKWTDAQIERAIRSGMAADGRALHWQGMIWDHASNWDEEDVRALIAYLRMLPPVERRVPAARPPAADDCAVYTFWIAPSREPGCRDATP